MHFIIDNQLNNTIKLFWVNHQGVRQHIQDISPHQTFIQGTTLGHVWVLQIPGADEVLFSSVLPTCNREIVSGITISHGVGHTLFGIAKYSSPPEDWTAVTMETLNSKRDEFNEAYDSGSMGVIEPWESNKCYITLSSGTRTTALTVGESDPDVLVVDNRVELFSLETLLAQCDEGMYNGCYKFINAGCLPAVCPVMTKMGGRQLGEVELAASDLNGNPGLFMARAPTAYA